MSAQVEAIIDERFRGKGAKKQHEYLIHWRGYKASLSSWEPAESIEDESLISAFHADGAAKSETKVVSVASEVVSINAQERVVESLAMSTPLGGKAQALIQRTPSVRTAVQDYA